MQFEAALRTLPFSRTSRSLQYRSTLRAAGDDARPRQIHGLRPQRMVPTRRTTFAFWRSLLPRLFFARFARLSVAVLISWLPIFCQMEPPPSVWPYSPPDCTRAASARVLSPQWQTNAANRKRDVIPSGAAFQAERGISLRIALSCYILSIYVSRLGSKDSRLVTSYNTSMIHEILPVGPLQCNCSIIGDEATREAMVIDPGDQIEDILALVREHNLQVKQIVVTHAHIDHVGGAMKLRAATGAPILLNQNDYALLKMLAMQAAWIGVPDPGKVEIDRSVTTGETVFAGSHTAKILHTPGHTEGSICLYFEPEKKLIAGDTLFAGSIGRTDLPGGDTQKIMRSLHNTVLALPDDTVVIPGHGELTTIGEERKSNPFLMKR
jgi:hydroxyacylglutathione hydrolase